MSRWSFEPEGRVLTEAVSENLWEEKQRDTCWHLPVWLSHPTARQKSRRKPLVITVTTNAWREEGGNLSITKWCRDERAPSSVCSAYTHTHTQCLHISFGSLRTTVSERKSKSNAFSSQQYNNVFSSQQSDCKSPPPPHRPTERWKTATQILN